jgi:uncharacterized protein YbjT (DUF2867 family)
MMKVLVCGARGFVGAAICDRLALAGHRVIKGVRNPRDSDEVAIDYSRDVEVGHWLSRLRGVDAVVNAVGILSERGEVRFDDIHRRAPIALFAACHAAGVNRVVQISALGVQRGGTGYYDSKLAADTFLTAQPLDWNIVRPSLIHGAEGKSARYFRMLASLPIHVLPAGGRQPLQPVHIDDVAEVVAKLVEPSGPRHLCLDVVGAKRVDYGEMLRVYRASMQLLPAASLGIPGRVMAMAASVSGCIPGSVLTRATWRMLQDGNIADAAPTTRLLGRSPLGIDAFITGAGATQARNEAFAAWRSGLLRIVLACVWLATAWVSAFAYPVADSLALLQRLHLQGAAAVTALYGATLLDFALGVATLLRPGRRLWLLQAALVSAYTLIIGVALPEFLFHPFGPILKNLPILAILLLLICEETRP